MWRLLKVGDIVESTDQVFQNQLGWLEAGKHSPHGVGITVNDKIALTIPIRRKISEQGETEKPIANTQSTCASQIADHIEERCFGSDANFIYLKEDEVRDIIRQLRTL